MAKIIDDETMENVCILAKLSLSEEEKEKATILLGYANMREEDIKEAVAILNQCWRK